MKILSNLFLVIAVAAFVKAMWTAMTGTDVIVIEVIVATVALVAHEYARPD